MLSRYFVSFNFAALITFGLFFAMQMLISQGEIKLDKKPARLIVDIGEVREVLPLTSRERLPERQAIEKIPELVVLDLPPTDGRRGIDGPVLPQVRPTAPTPDKGGDIFSTEGDFVKILIPAPRYPADMAAKGIEGFVRVKYTVSETGSTEDVVVVSSSHRGFEKNAIKAAQKFKFKPRVEDGVAIAVPDVYNLIEFKLES